MHNKFDSRTILAVFELIQQKGKSSKGGYQLDGMQAYTDHDGYSVYLSADDVTLHLGFHNTYELEYPDGAHAERFVNRMNGLIRTYLQPQHARQYH